MAKMQQSSVSDIDLQFPLSGINEERAFSRQQQGTSIDMENVRSFEPTTGRARGSQRGGLVKFFSAKAVTTNAPGTSTEDGVVYPIQCVTHLVGTDTPPASDYGRFSYAQAINVGFGVGNGSDGGSLYSAIGAESGYQLANSCWDDLGILYVAMVKQGDNPAPVKIIAFNASGAAIGSAPNGTVIWTLTGQSVLTGALRNVPGMCCTPTHLFVALTTGSPALGANCRIVRINKALGTTSATDALWRLGSTLFELAFSTASINCLCAIGHHVYVLMPSSAREGFILDLDGSQGQVYWASGAAPAGLYDRASASVSGTSANSRTRIVTDGSSLYVVSPTSTGQVKKYTNALVKEWTSTAADGSAGVRDIAYDKKNSQLVAICDAAPSIRSLSLTTGLSIASETLGGVFYDTIDSDGQGTYILFKNSVASNDTLGISAPALGTLWGPQTRSDAVHTGVSVNKGNASIPFQPGPRVIVPMLVAGGEIRRFSSSGPVAIINGSNSTSRVLSGSAKQVFAAQLDTNMFFADGSGYYYYQGGGVSGRGTVKTWTPTSGTLPVDSPVPNRARGICMWRRGIVLWGLPNSPQNWFRSKLGDGFDWNYNPTPTTTIMATNGTVSRAGMPGDAINCWIPYSDDVAVILCDHSIYTLKGDPLLGGVFDKTSSKVGGLFGDAWTIDGNEQIYFYAPVGGVFKMVPGAMPMRVSQQIERHLDNVDVTANTISLAWDLQLQCLNVWVTPHDRTQAATNFCFEERSQSWVKDRYENKGHQPFAVHEFDGDSPEDRKIFVGGRDGYLRIMSNDAEDDDGKPINSYAWIGPITNKSLDDMMLHEMQATLSDGSGDVYYEVYVGRTVEEAYNSTPVASGKWGAKRNNVSAVRRSGFAVLVKLLAYSPFAIERIRAKIEPLGPVRRIM